MVLMTDSAMDQLAKCLDHKPTIDDYKYQELLHQIKTLDHWFGKRCYCEVQADSAPLSFTWCCWTDQSKTEQLISGGLIFHGHALGWSIHT